MSSLESALAVENGRLGNHLVARTARVKELFELAAFPPARPPDPSPPDPANRFKLLPLSPRHHLLKPLFSSAALRHQTRLSSFLPSSLSTMSTLDRSQTTIIARLERELAKREHSYS
jgi:hypothetical protein